MFPFSGAVHVHHPEENSASSRKGDVSFCQQSSSTDKVCCKYVSKLLKRMSRCKFVSHYYRADLAKQNHCLFPQRSYFLRPFCLHR